jgi:RNA polymerase sigma factor for flagellar operon FliA
MATPKKKTGSKVGAASGAKKKAPAAAKAKSRRPAAKKPAAKAARTPGQEPETENVMITRQAGRNAAIEIETRVRARMETQVEADEVSTEELWTLYRKEASRRGAKQPDRLDELRNHLIERHYPLVRYIAERLLQTLPKSIELDDLVSAGLFGLMDAIRGFDASRGIKFKTYCSTRIRGAILDQLRSQDWVPRLVRLKASRIDRALQRLTAEYGREPTHAELARTLEMEHGDLVKEIQESRAKTMFSLSEKWEDDDGSVEKVEILEDKTATDPVHEMNRRDLMNFITRALTHKERFIIEQYYQYGHTMREIGEMLALTESRVCQIHSNVMSRLKGLLGQRHESLLS